MLAVLATVVEPFMQHSFTLKQTVWTIPNSFRKLFQN